MIGERLMLAIYTESDREERSPTLPFRGIA